MRTVNPQGDSRGHLGLRVCGACVGCIATLGSRRLRARRLNSVGGRKAQRGGVIRISRGLLSLIRRVGVQGVVAKTSFQTEDAEAVSSLMDNPSVDWMRIRGRKGGEFVWYGLPNRCAVPVPNIPEFGQVTNWLRAHDRFRPSEGSLRHVSRKTRPHLHRWRFRGRWVLRCNRLIRPASVTSP